MLCLTVALGVITLLLLEHTTPTAAKHALCYWTGPGTGTPKDQGFTLFCTARKFDVPKKNPADPSQVQYCCLDDYGSNSTVVADWNVLREQVLEFATPCNNDGYSDDCSWGLWGFTFELSSPHQTVSDPL